MQMNFCVQSVGTDAATAMTRARGRRNGVRTDWSAALRRRAVMRPDGGALQPSKYDTPSRR